MLINLLLVVTGALICAVASGVRFKIKKPDRLDYEVHMIVWKDCFGIGLIIGAIIVIMFLDTVGGFSGQ